MSPATSLSKWPAALAVVLCVALRIAVWPGYNELRDVDEPSYVQSGLQAWEGMQPAMRHTPNGPQTWLTLACAALSTADQLLSAKETPASPLLRVGHAMDAALFRCYRDSNPLRAVHLLFSAVLAAVTTWILYRTGLSRAGLAGGFALAGWVLLTPSFIRYGGMAHPYSCGWSFAALAMAFSLEPRRLVHSAVCLGLAAACRLELAALFPILIGTIILNRETRAASAIARCAAIAAGTFALAAPWFLAGLIGGFRNLVVIGVFRSGNAPRDGAGNLQLILSEGWLGWVLVAIAGTILTLWRQRLRGWPALVWMIPLGALATYHAREPRYNVVWAIALIPAIVSGLNWTGSLKHYFPSALSALILVPLISPAAKTVNSVRQERVLDFSTEWIEAHVPADTKIYFIPGLRTPLPTPESGTRLWEEVAGANSWKAKFAESGQRLGFDVSAVPRAMTLEPLVLEQGNRRRWWLLSGDRAGTTPRYDLYPNDSVAFGTRDALKAFQEQGGCLVVRGAPLDEAIFGKPAHESRAQSGTGVFVYLKGTPKREI